MSVPFQKGLGLLYRLRPLSRVLAFSHPLREQNASRSWYSHLTCSCRGNGINQAHHADWFERMPEGANTPKLVFQLMMFPATDFRLNTPSMEECGEGYNVTRPMMVWIRKNYLTDPADWIRPLASPLLAPDLSGLPPALIMTAEYDPLRDDGELYGKRLQAAGVPVRISRYDGMLHDFPDMFEGPGNRALDEIASALGAAFG